MSSSSVIGVDVGGTKLAAVALRDGDVVAERTRGVGPQPIVDQVIGMAREVAAGLGGHVDAVGVAVPGHVDAESGIIELAVNLAVRDLPVGPLVADALGAPCFVEHDARAVAAWLAEAEGAGADLAFLNVGTGISAGVVLDGVVLRGANGLAGEIGHALADPAAGHCACGLVGCLETVAAGPAIARRGGQGTAPETFLAAAGGDARARRAIDDAARHLAAAVRALALAFGVRRVVVGGGVARAGEPFSGPLLAAVDGERMSSKLIARALPAGAVEILGDARPIGALAAAAAARRCLGATRPEGEVGTR